MGLGTGCCKTLQAAGSCVAIFGNVDYRVINYRETRPIDSSRVACIVYDFKSASASCRFSLHFDAGFAMFQKYLELPLPLSSSTIVARGAFWLKWFLLGERELCYLVTYGQFQTHPLTVVFALRYK